MLSKRGTSLTSFLVASLLVLLSPLQRVEAIGQDSCVSFQSSADSFSIVHGGKAAPILISPDDWPGVQLAASDFAADIHSVASVKPSLTNVTSSKTKLPSQPVIIGTLGKSSLIDQIVNATSLDVSGIKGKWEAFMSRVVKNPLPGVESAYVIIGADKRGTIFALYDHSEQFGVSPWYWWADVPPSTHSSIFVSPSGCAHGSPTVKYRGIFLNDEQPALQNWAAEKFTNGTGAMFNRFFYSNLFELILRMKGNYLWPAMWGAAFALDDSQNQFLADYYGVVMGTSHQEPMMRATPNEFSRVATGNWDYTGNTDVINQYWLDGAKRAKPFESVFTLGMRGFGDLPLSEETNIALLEGVIANQTQILKDAFGPATPVETIPQVWCLYKEVEAYYRNGMRVPEYVTLLWPDDNWGNIRRFPTLEERNRTGGAGVYYHVDYVGDPRDYKWIVSSQVEKIYEQMSIAVQREATRLWILNVGDLKPYERETEFFLSLGWNATRWKNDNLASGYVQAWARREFNLGDAQAKSVVDIVANLTRWNSRRKAELMSPQTYSLINYREAETTLDGWATLESASTAIYKSLPSKFKPAFFQLVHHPVLASANLAKIYVYAGQNNARASQARLSTNDLADKVEEFFEKDYDLEIEYHQLLDGKWDHMMDQTHIGYYYWQQPMTNTMPAINRVQKRKQGLAGVMRISPEGTPGVWPGDNPSQCAQGYGCPPPSIAIDNFSTIKDRFVDVGAGGPKPFTFTAKASASWLTVSPASGSVSPKNSEVRVFATVNDWSKVPGASASATITFTAKAAGEADLSVPVTLVATKNAVSSGFKGFVEGTGVISIEAAHAMRNTTVQGTSWAEIPGYGRTLSAVVPWPRSDATFAAGSGPVLEYDFYNFNTRSGSVDVTVFLSTSLNGNTDDHPLAYAIGIDSQAPVKVTPVGPSKPGDVPAGWGTWVSNANVNVTTSFKINPGAHTLKLFAVEPAVVVQKIVINAGGLQPSYLGPPESIVV